MLKWIFTVLAFVFLGLTSAQASFHNRSIEPAPLRGGQRMMQVPVTWELLRSGFNTLDAALEAETFSETWGLYQVSPYEYYLLTTRGKTRFIPLRMQEETPEGSWDTLALNESEFARVLGIDHSPWHSLDAMIFLALHQIDAESQTIVLTASPQYFISISISFD